MNWWDDTANTNTSGTWTFDHEQEIRFEDVKRAWQSFGFDPFHRQAETDSRFAGLDRASLGRLIRTRIETTRDRGELERALETLTKIGQTRDPSSSGLAFAMPVRAAIHKRLAELIGGTT